MVKSQTMLKNCISAPEHIGCDNAYDKESMRPGNSFLLTFVMPIQMQGVQKTPKEMEKRFFNFSDHRKNRAFLY